eukprot:scpid54524/ scgid25842/ F-box only protein 40
MAEVHEHCNSCYDKNCSSGAHDCLVVDCSNNCGARFHSCKQAEHISLCSRAVVACVNSQHGCPFSFDRQKQASHLRHCPASVVCCSHLWFRRNRAEREPGELVSDPPVPLAQLDFRLALRDQQQVGGAEALQTCSVDPRPTQLACPGADIIPRSESLETLDVPCFSPSAVRVVPALTKEAQLVAGDAPGSPDLDAEYTQAQQNDGFVADNVSFMSERLLETVAEGDDADSGCYENNSSTAKTSNSDSAESRCDGQSASILSQQTSDNTATTSSRSGSASSKTTASKPSAQAATRQGENGSGGGGGKAEATTTSVPAPDTSLDGEKSGDDNKSLSGQVGKRDSSGSVASILSSSPKGGIAGGKPARNKQLTKLLGGLRGSRDNSLDQSAPVSVSSAASYGGEGDAFQASMGTKLRTHMQSSKRKIAKVFSGKILSRSNAVQGQDVTTPAARNVLKHKLVSQHAPLGESLSLEVVTHKDSVVVDGDDALWKSPYHRSSCTQTVTPDESIRSEFSIMAMPSPMGLRQRWKEDDSRFSKSHLFTERATLIENQLSACNKLFFELCHFYNARHIYPDDGFIQCQCLKVFRRDEIAEHQSFVHAGVDSLLSSGKLLERCPLAMFGCRQIRQTLQMPQKNWRIDVVKGAVAVVPATSVRSVVQTTDAVPTRHLTTLPTGILQIITSYLDPISLTCLAETCQHMRQLVSCSIQDRGMVVPVWQRSEDEDSGEVSWSVQRQQWTLSTFTQSVPLNCWRPSNEPTMAEHLQSCRVARMDTCQHGAQWKPLLGLTDVRAFSITRDSDYESEEEEDESESEEEGKLEVTICAPVSTSSAVSAKVRSRLTMLRQRGGAGSQVTRKAKNSIAEEEDEFQKSLAVGEILGEEADAVVDDDDEVVDE